MDNVARDLAGIELDQIRAYREIFIETNPYPREPDYERFTPRIFDEKNYSFVKIMGIKATGFVLAALGGIVYSAIRTMGIFADIVNKELTQFGWEQNIVIALVVASAFSIVLGVEGFLASYGYGRGEESGKLKTNWIGPVVAILISALAGMLASLSLVGESAEKDNIYNFIRWALAFSGGVGIIALVYFGAENMGVIRSQWIAYLNEREKEITEKNKLRHDEIEEKNKKLREDYNAAVKTWQDDFERDYRLKAREVLFGAGTFTVKRGEGSPKETSAQMRENVMDSVRVYLKQNGVLPSQVGMGPDYRLRPVQIADAIKMTGKSRENIHKYLARLREEEAQGKW